MAIYTDLLKRLAEISMGQDPSTVKGGLDPDTPTSADASYAQLTGTAHVGIDFKADKGEPVYAPFDAKAWVGKQAGGTWANGTKYEAAEYLLLTDANGYGLGLYHLDTITARSGSVKAGQQVGTVGAKGKATGPHLHAQVFKDKVYYDVYWYLFNQDKKADVSVDSTYKDAVKAEDGFYDWPNTDKWEKDISPKRFRVTTSWQKLNIRKSPGTDKELVGAIDDKSIISIDKLCTLPDKQVWGRLAKSPWNWVCLERGTVNAVEVKGWPERLTTGYYTVRKTATDTKTQKGAFTILANAKRMAAANKGYKVYSPEGFEVN